MILNFRLYDKEHEEMEYYEDYSALSDMFINLDVDDGTLEEPMQSTGLLDINDKEIYVGDLVKCDISDNIIRDCAYEVFDNGFELVLKSKFGNWPLVRYIDYIEIVGNIHQNLNLLEADNHD